MANKINVSELAGQKFNALVIQKAWRNSKKDIIVRCLCDCAPIKADTTPRNQATPNPAATWLQKKGKSSKQWEAGPLIRERKSFLCPWEF